MTTHTLRRSDRALTRDEALAVFDEAAYVVVSTTDSDGTPYGVPLSFVRRGDALYFHATNEGGHKADDFRAEARVCATVVVDVEPFFAHGEFSTHYRSAMAFGRVREVEDTGEFKHALVALCMKYLPEAKSGIGAAMRNDEAHTAVWAITIDELSGKANLPTTAPEKEI